MWSTGSGREVGPAIVAHPEVQRHLLHRQHCDRRAPLQRRAPRSSRSSRWSSAVRTRHVVFGDCDFERAVEGAVRAAFANQGEICLCGSRILIEHTIYARFREALVERVKRLRLGDPMDADTDQGALVSEVHLEKVLRQSNRRVPTAARYCAVANA